MTTKPKAKTPPIATMRRKLTAANKRADEATERLADLEVLIAQRLNPPNPFDLWDEINKLCARAAATKAWQALAYETICRALGVPVADEPPTFGRILELIERLCAAFQRLNAFEKEIASEQIDQDGRIDLVDPLALVGRVVTINTAPTPTTEPADPGMHDGPCEDLDGSGACFGCGAWLGGDDDEPGPQEPQP